MEDESLSRAYDSRLMRRLLGYLSPYKFSVAISLLLLTGHSLSAVSGPWLTKLAIDRYLVKTPGTTWAPLENWLSPSPNEGILQITLLYLCAIIITFLCEFGQALIMQSTGQKAMFDLRKEVMGHLQRLDLHYYDTHPIGRMLTRVTSDIDVLNELFSSGLVTLLGDLLMLVLVAVAMFQLNGVMTILLLAVAPLMIYATMRFRKAVTESYRRIRTAVARMNAYLSEHIQGIGVVQLFQREQRSKDEFEQINKQHMDAFKESIHAYGWFYPMVEFLGMLGLASLLAWGGYQVSAGALSLGVLVAFFQYGMRFFRPIQDLSEKYNILQGAMAASERVFQLIDTEVKIKAPAFPKSVPTGDVEFDHVWFAYEKENWILEDLSFRIGQGESIAIVGHTGAGKTTIIQLLLRFYDIQKGAIKIGGVDIREFEPSSLRQYFGVVLQDPYLFTGTIAENIRLGSPRITDAVMKEAADRVNLRTFVESLGRKFEEPVIERGASLSTGQKQLIGFARALAHNPSFLILDEATSSVDTETELKIRSALTKLVEGRTSILIAHRLSTVERADRIFVMHKGKLRESGSHQQLLAERGIYWKLFRLQYKDQEVSAQ